MGHLVWPFLCANLSRFTSLIAEYRTPKTETQANNVTYWALPVHCDGLYKWCFETWATAFVSQIDPSPLLYTLAGSCRSSRVFKCMHVSLFAIQRCLCKWKRVRRKIIYLKQLKLLFLILAKLWYCSTPLVRYMMGNKWPVLLSGKQSSSLLFLVTDAEIYLMKVDQLL